MLPEDYLSEKYLERCLERKGWFEPGWVKSYRVTDPDSVSEGAKGWAVWGSKKVKFLFMNCLIKIVIISGTERTSNLVLPKVICETQS